MTTKKKAARLYGKEESRDDQAKKVRKGQQAIETLTDQYLSVLRLQITCHIRSGIVD